MQYDIDEILKAAIQIAKKGGNHTLQYFNQNVEVEFKSDDSPVTQADREGETLMREAIQEEFPDHGILGEEYGRMNGKSEIQWILDPIDGTLSFIHGVPLYTTLVGVLIADEPVVGIIYAPALDELCDAAKNRGARLNGTTCSVSGCKELSKATLLTTDINSVREYDMDKPFEALLSETRIHRTWGDAYGHMLVATGRADIMFDPILNIWDAAPLLTILQEAGGSFTDVDGNPTIKTGNGFSCNKNLFKPIKKIFEQSK